MKLKWFGRMTARLAAATAVLATTLVVTGQAAHAVDVDGLLVNVEKYWQTVAIQGQDRNYGNAWEYGVETEVGAGFKVRSTPNQGGHTLQEFHSPGRCLDSNSAGDAYGIPCNGGTNQRWYMISKGTWYSSYWGRTFNIYEMKNRATGRCLDANGQDVYTLGCNGGTYQTWFLW